MRLQPSTSHHFTPISGVFTGLTRNIQHKTKIKDWRNNATNLPAQRNRTIQQPPLRSNANRIQHVEHGISTFISPSSTTLKRNLLPRNYFMMERARTSTTLATPAPSHVDSQQDTHTAPYQPPTTQAVAQNTRGLMPCWRGSCTIPSRLGSHG